MNKRYQLSPDYSISRIINGGWQLSKGHRLDGNTEKDDIFDVFSELTDRGFTTFDCADIYTGVEELYGRFLKQYLSIPGRQREDIQFHTKYVPDRSSLETTDRESARSIIHRSLKRLGVDTLDLIQFHWWDYSIPGYIETAGYLNEMKREGKIRHIGLTNFDTAHLKEIIDAGIPVISNQVQYSLLDRRPENSMTALCEENGISLLCYGTLAGGFLSEKWLGQTPPETFNNRSQVKYNLIIDEFGGWEAYQKLLKKLTELSIGKQCSTANIATAYILSKENVAAGIIGTRSSRHIKSNEKVFDVKFTAEEIEELDTFLSAYPGPSGEPFELERIPGGRHERIMKTNLNSKEGDNE